MAEIWHSSRIQELVQAAGQFEKSFQAIPAVWLLEGQGYSKAPIAGLHQASGSRRICPVCGGRSGDIHPGLGSNLVGPLTSGVAAVCGLILLSVLFLYAVSTISAFFAASQFGWDLLPILPLVCSVSLWLWGGLLGGSLGFCVSSMRGEGGEISFTRQLIPDTESGNRRIYRG